MLKIRYTYVFRLLLEKKLIKLFFKFCLFAFKCVRVLENNHCQNTHIQSFFCCSIHTEYLKMVLMLKHPLNTMFLFIFSDLRYFKLYLTTNTGLFTDNVKAVFVDEHGRETNYDIQLQNYFTGHVVGE